MHIVPIVDIRDVNPMAGMKIHMMAIDNQVRKTVHIKVTNTRILTTIGEFDIGCPGQVDIGVSRVEI